MRSYNPIETVAEFNQTCKANREALVRVVEYLIDDLDSGWRNLSRRDSDIRKHQLKFLEDLVNEINNAAAGSITTTNVRG